jgi:hypothetical protein
MNITHSVKQHTLPIRTQVRAGVDPFNQTPQEQFDSALNYYNYYKNECERLSKCVGSSWPGCDVQSRDGACATAQQLQGVVEQARLALSKA